MLPLVRRCWMMPFARCVAGLGERHVGVKTFSCGIMGMIFVQLFPVGMIKMYLMVIAMGLLHRQKLGFLGPRKFFGFFLSAHNWNCTPKCSSPYNGLGLFHCQNGRSLSYLLHVSEEVFAAHVDKTSETSYTQIASPLKVLDPGLAMLRQWSHRPR